MLAKAQSKSMPVLCSKLSFLAFDESQVLQLTWYLAHAQHDRHGTTPLQIGHVGSLNLMVLIFVDVKLLIYLFVYFITLASKYG